MHFVLSKPCKQYAKRISMVDLFYDDDFFQKMTLLNINPYTSLDQKVPLFQIAHLHINGNTKSFFHKLKTFEGLSSHEEVQSNRLSKDTRQ